MVFNKVMENKKKKLAKITSDFDFEQMDHRLACGWHVEIEGSGQRKRYLRQVAAEKVPTDVA